MGVFKKNNPGNCVDANCGCVAVCASSRLIFFNVTAICGAPVSGAVCTLYLAGSSIGTCTTTGSPPIGQCVLDVVALATGTVLDYDIVYPGAVTRTGTVAVPACGDYALIEREVFGYTDPTGNMIAMTFNGTNRWTGSRSYADPSTVAADSNTISFIFGSVPASQCPIGTAGACDLYIAWLGDVLGSCSQFDGTGTVINPVGTSVANCGSTDGFRTFSSYTPLLFTARFGSNCASDIPFFSGSISRGTFTVTP